MTYVWLDWLPDALRDEGCSVITESGWSSRGRPASTGAFNPSGVLVHHTGTTASSSNPHPTLHMCMYEGRPPDLPAPLCQGLICYAGDVHVVAAGRANHAGAANASGPMPAGDGNALYVGWECDYNGSQKMSGAQYDAMILASAAVCRHFGRSSAYVRGHKETSQTGKWDPGQYSMDHIRSDVSYVLSGQSEDDDMPLTQDEINRIAQAVWQFKITDVDEAQRPAATVVKYVRSDTTHIRHVGPQDHWAFELADDVNQEKYQAQRLLRYTRNDAHAAHCLLTGDETTEQRPGAP